jgi:hypothetical protein
VLSVRVYLLDDSAGARSVVYQNHHEIAVPLKAASAQEFTLGAGRAWRQVADALASELINGRDEGMAPTPAITLQRR